MADGEILAGRYQLIRVIGRGAMGQVWLSHDLLLDRPVAIKQLIADNPDPDVVERAMREARLAGRLSHPNAVAVYDLILDGGRPHVVMEYVEGTTLADRLVDGQTLSPTAAGSIIGQIAGGLAAAHRMGIVHRDIKPANLLLSPNGGAKLADFGIAHADSNPALTATGLVIGTVSYMAPEIAQGKPASDSADVWSLGATLFAALEGHPVFPGANTVAVLAQLITRPAPSPAHAGPLRELIEDMLAREPADRPAAEYVRHALTRSARADATGWQRATPIQPPVRTQVPAPAPAAPYADADLDATARSASSDVTSGAHALPAWTALTSTALPSVMPPVTPRRRRRTRRLLLAAATTVVVVAAAVGAVAALREHGSSGTDRAATVDPPSAVSAVIVTPGPADGAATVSYAQPRANGGRPSVECTVTSAGDQPCGNWLDIVPDGSSVHHVVQLSAGRRVDLSLVACSIYANAKHCSEPVSAVVDTYGAPVVPSAPTCTSNAGVLTFGWKAVATGRPLSSFAATVDGISTASSAPTARALSRTFPRDGRTHVVRVAAVDSAGERSTTLAIPCVAYKLRSSGALDDVVGDAGGTTPNDVRSVTWTVDEKQIDFFVHFAHTPVAADWVLLRFDLDHNDADGCGGYDYSLEVRPTTLSLRPSAGRTKDCGTWTGTDVGSTTALSDGYRVTIPRSVLAGAGASVPFDLQSSADGTTRVDKLPDNNDPALLTL